MTSRTSVRTVSFAVLLRVHLSIGWDAIAGPKVLFHIKYAIAQGSMSERVFFVCHWCFSQI